MSLPLRLPIRPFRLVLVVFLILAIVWLSFSSLQEPTTQHPRRAFATLLTPYKPDRPDLDPEDHYLTTVRILTYQLIHAPDTRSNLPLLVLMTSDLSKDIKNRLKADGATIVEVEKITSDGLYVPFKRRWTDILTKLRMYQVLEMYDQICYMDADTILQSSIADIWDDPAVQLRQTGNNTTQLKSDEGSMPAQYLLAAKSESFGHLETDHTAKPSREFGAGFMIFKPDHLLFDYYMSLLPLVATNISQPKEEQRWWYANGEQNLLAYAHREEGNMPWQELQWDWNVHPPNTADIRAGIKSLHGRLWKPDTEDEFDRSIMDVWWAKRREMLAYWGGKEGWHGDPFIVDAPSGPVRDGQDGVADTRARKVDGLDNTDLGGDDFEGYY